MKMDVPLWYYSTKGDILILHFEFCIYSTVVTALTVFAMVENTE